MFGWFKKQDELIVGEVATDEDGDEWNVQGAEKDENGEKLYTLVGPNGGSLKVRIDHVDTK